MPSDREPLVAIGVTLDCADPLSLAEFWQAAGGFERREGNGEPYVTLSRSDASRPLNHLTLQKVPESKTAKCRVHLDLFTRNMDDEVNRLRTLGATVLTLPDATDPDGHLGFIATVMADPEGNEFCVVARPART